MIDKSTEKYSPETTWTAVFVGLLILFIIIWIPVKIGSLLPDHSDINATLFVNYRLIEICSDTEIWKENLLSHYTAKVKEVFYGAERARIAIAGAVRDNLTQLVRKLSYVLIKLK